MRISLNWLKDYVDFRLEPEELAHRLTMAGLEVSSIEAVGADIDQVVVAQIQEKGSHPDADRLSLCRVFDGSDVHDIVCGATNMKEGDKVALARVGTRLPGGFKIKKSKIRGQLSYGMMCSERELGLSDDHGGIMILPEGSPLGSPLIEVLGLPDTVLEVELTPNRSDCLSVVGVAREVAAITGADLRIPEPQVVELGDSVDGQTSVEIVDPDLCHRYAARIIRGVKLRPSPLWMKQRLQAAGVRSISNVVDVTNYVLLELGHPLHAFDLHRLYDERIVVRRARSGEVFTTLDGQDRSLDGDTLMICDGEKSVAVAGIMGGLNSEVQEDTVDLLLESAYFAPANIRRSSKRLGLSTEASYRFERGTDIDGLIRALDRATELIVELADGEVAKGIWDAYPTPHEPQQVNCRPSKVHAVLGVPVPRDEMVRCLSSLGLEPVVEQDEAVSFRIPTHRVDLEREIDLIEEVARVYGYDRIPTTLPKAAMAGKERPVRMRVSDTARNALVSLGLQEAISLSFIDPAEDDRLGYAEDSLLRKKVVLQNPLNTETAVLRTSLLPGLLRSAGLNARRQTGDIRLFEVGRTFHPEEGEVLPREVLRAGWVLGGRRQPVGWWARSDAVDYYDLKGILEGLLKRLGIVDYRVESTAGEVPWLHPGRAGWLVANEVRVGWLGQLHPDRVEEYEVPAGTYVCEIDLDRLQEMQKGICVFPGLDRYPAVERDLALVLSRDTRVQQVLDAVDAFASPLIRSTTLFDIYEGEHLAADKVSMAFRVVYRSEDRTLTEEEVQVVEKALLQHLEKQVGAQLRGG